MLSETAGVLGPLSIQGDTEAPGRKSRVERPISSGPE